MSHITELNQCPAPEILVENLTTTDNDSKDIVSEVLKNIFQTVVNRTDTHIEGVENVGYPMKNKKHKKARDFGDASTPVYGSDNSLAAEKRASMISDAGLFTGPEKEFRDVPIVKYSKEAELLLDSQLENIIQDLTDINIELEHNCGVHKGLAAFLEGQGEFTKEILDAYITSSDLTKDIHIKSTIEQKPANHDFLNPYIPDQSTKEEIPEEYGEEKLLNVTNLDTDPASYPLPDESDEEINQNKNDPIEIVAEIHATISGDHEPTENTDTPLSTNIGEAGECKTEEPILEPDSKEKEDEDKKKRNSLRRRVWNFFAKGQKSSNKSKKHQ